SSPTTTVRSRSSRRKQSELTNNQRKAEVRTADVSSVRGRLRVRRHGPLSRDPSCLLSVVISDRRSRLSRPRAPRRSSGCLDELKMREAARPAWREPRPLAPPPERDLVEKKTLGV